MSTESQQQRSFAPLSRTASTGSPWNPTGSGSSRSDPRVPSGLATGAARSMHCLPRSRNHSAGRGIPLTERERLAGPSVPCSATPDRALNLAPRTWFDRAGLQSPMPRRRRIRRCI